MYSREEIEKVASEIRKSTEWDLDLCERLCDMAGLRAEWEAADGMGFEDVIYSAAEKLGVEII